MCKLRAIHASNWHLKARSVAADVNHEPAIEFGKMKFRKISASEAVVLPFNSDPDWVAKTTCFSADDVPPWLKLKAGAFNVAPKVNCRLGDVKERHGNAYKLALLGCLNGGGDWTLVHGETVAPNRKGRMGHAWLERDGWVYDAVLDRVWPWHIYASFVSAVSLRSYSHSETLNLAVETGHCGPW
jgi:hypothetical protein